MEHTFFAAILEHIFPMPYFQMSRTPRELFSPGIFDEFTISASRLLTGSFFHEITYTREENMEKEWKRSVL
jgi:hypothetical protein